MPADPSPPPGMRSILEPVRPHPGSFAAAGMARGEPGVPRRFDWRGRTYEVAEVLESRRETHREGGAQGENYVRRHAFRVRTTTGEVMLLSGARGTSPASARWTLRYVEEPPAS